MSTPVGTVAVGDPVDVMTGVQFDVALDFRIAWSFPFEWLRFYSTARAGERLALGWGHTHGYDHRLWFDADGLLYLDPSGGRHAFAVPEADGRASVSATGVLQRVTARAYRVKVGGHPRCEFHFADPARPAQLARVFRGRAAHELRYALDGRWVEVAYGAELPVRVESDDAGRVHALAWRTGAAGRDRVLWGASYDAAGDLVRAVDPYGGEQTFGYDADHRMVRRTDRRGYGFEAVYDHDGRCVRSAGADGVQEVRLSYRPDQRATVVTRADGGAWQYAYAPEGVTAVVDPYGGVVRRSYAADGGLERETGPAGEVIRQRVDDESTLVRAPFGPRAGMCLPLGDPWFDAVRELDQAEDALDWEGYGTARTRNGIGFPRADRSWLRALPPAVARQLRLAANPEEAHELGAVRGPRAGEPPPVADALGASASGIGASGGAMRDAWLAPAPKKPMRVPDYPGVLRHDAFGRPVSHTLPTGESCRWLYDGNGNVTRYIDYAGSEWRYEYASWNLRVRETDPLGHAVATTWDLLERPARVTDAGGTATIHRYDLKDRLTERWRHAERRDAFAYDASDGVVAAVAGGSPRVALTLGPHRRPTEVAVAGRLPRRCAYDERGRLTGVADDAESLAFAYDADGERTMDLRDGRGVARRYADARLLECTVLGRFVTRYVHDLYADRVTIVDPAGGTHVVEQLDSGVYLRRHANGVEELAQFDWRGQCLAKVRFTRGRSAELWSRVYRYSAVGALLAAADSVRGTAEYQYDAAHRLVGAAGPAGRRDAYAYDAAGNLVGAPGLAGVAVDGNRLVAANGRRFEYDARHHVARDVATNGGRGADRAYAYDAEDRLVRCRVGDDVLEFRYDALGRRVSKTSPSGTTHFVWDGERVAAEVAPDGALRVYVYADGVAMTPFAFVDYADADADPASGARRYVFADQVACPVRVEDDRGDVLWRAAVDPYGRAAVAPGSRLTLHLRWPGHYHDAETGLHYNRHRYYSPELGRYLQADPRDLAGGVNVYAYPARPLDRVDVDGMEACPKKPMVTPAANDKKFQKAKRRADRIAEDMRNEIKAAIKAGRKRGDDMRHLENTTCAAMVVTRPKNKYEVVVTANRSPAGLPRRVREAADGARWIGHGDDRPPPVRQTDDSHRYGRDKPTTGDREDSTHGHAEQRGLRANDCDGETGGVAYIAPTRPCCEGCSTAIQTPHSGDMNTSSQEGGWGGGNDNVSDRGREPGPHGNWWDD